MKLFNQMLKMKTSCGFSDQRIEQELALIMDHFNWVKYHQFEQNGEKYWSIYFPCGLNLVVDRYFRANVTNFKSIDLGFQLDQPGDKEELIYCLSPS